MSELTCCLDCGMPVWPNEYHPFAACLMFRGCQNSAVVRANLPDIRPVDSTAAPVVVGEVTDDMICRFANVYYGRGKKYGPDRIRAALTAALAGD